VRLISRSQQKSVFATHYRSLVHCKEDGLEEGKLPAHFSQQDVLGYISDLEALEVTAEAYGRFLADIRGHERAGTIS
jgi:hypothetical protein